jgi:hypothetical protein
MHANGDESEMNAPLSCGMPWRYALPSTKDPARTARRFGHIAKLLRKIAPDMAEERHEMLLILADGFERMADTADTSPL